MIDLGGNKPDEVPDTPHAIHFSGGELDTEPFLDTHQDHDLPERVPAFDILRTRRRGQPEIITLEYVAGYLSHAGIDCGFVWQHRLLPPGTNGVYRRRSSLRSHDGFCTGG